MTKKIGIICAVAVVLAAVFCLYQFTDVFGAKQNVAAAAAATAFAEVPAADEAPAEEASAEPAADENLVLATVDGNEITLGDTKAMLSTLVSGGYINDANDYKTALDYMIQTRILSDKITELGFDQFTDEEKAEFAVKAQAEWEEAIQQYVNYFGGGDDANVEQTRQEAAEYYNTHGITLETVARQYENQAAQEKLEAYMLDGKDVTVPEADIQKTLDLSLPLQPIVYIVLMVLLLIQSQAVAKAIDFLVIIIAIRHRLWPI